MSFEMKEPLPFTVGYVKDGIYTEVYQVQEQDITETSSGRYSICMSFPETGSYSVVIQKKTADTGSTPVPAVLHACLGVNVLGISSGPAWPETGEGKRAGCKWITAHIFRGKIRTVT